MPRKMDISFPTAGVIRRSGLRAAAEGEGPFPTPWATNVRLEDSLTNRLRGGSFTGIDAGARPDPVYRDRAITFSGGAITAARQGDSTDTALSADVSDAARPVLFQLAEAGATGSDVVAVVPHKDSHLLCFTASETWVLAGNPAVGALRRVSGKVGILGANAWCVNHDMVSFLSSQGLYSVGADGSGLKAVSEDRIPDELTGVDDADCTLTYQHSDRSVYIHKTGLDWLYDTAREGFWPFDTDTAQSHVLLGPFRLGNPDSYGRVLNIQGTVAQGSGTVTWALVTGSSEEVAAANGKLAIEAAIAGNDYSSYVQASDTWSAGRNHIAYPRTRAVAAVLWLSASSDWAFESVSLEAMLSGKWR